MSQRVDLHRVARIIADGTGLSDEEVVVMVIGGAVLTAVAVGMRIFDTIETVRSAVRS